MLKYIIKIIYYNKNSNVFMSFNTLYNHFPDQSLLPLFTKR